MGFDNDGCEPGLTRRVAPERARVALHVALAATVNFGSLGTRGPWPPLYRRASRWMLGARQTLLPRKATTAS